MSHILSFLSDSFHDGLQYRSINVFRSALSSTHPKIDGYAVGQHPYVVKLMKGILNNYLPSVSSLSSLDLHHYKLLPEGLVFTLTVATKTTRLDETVEAFFTRFPEDSKLCPVECFNTYLSSTSRLRNLSEAQKSNNLFVSYIKPRQPVTTASVARWIRSFLTEAGIDTSVFKTHSVRGAATSAAANAFVPVQELKS